ncbi:MAG: hypothetical protein ACLQU4_08755 [Limisphaerales bacterium]
MNQKAIYIGIVVVIALLFALPATRDELDWLWAKSRDQATDYMQYYTDWPKGLHTAEARHCYDERTWSETKRAMISEAVKKHAARKSGPEARQEQQARQERFFWKEATKENTVTSYQDYLTRYPAGQFAADARRQIDDLTRQSTSRSKNSSGQ